MAESEGNRGGEAPGNGGVLDETPPNQARPGFGRSAVREQGERVKQRARVKGSEAKETAQRKVEDLKQQAERRTDELASRAGERASVLARALRRAGEELRNEGEDRFAGLTEDAAAQVERFGSYLEGHRPNEMMADLERTARGNPALFVGGTFALGLLLGRFLRSEEPAADVVFEPEGDWHLDGGLGPRGDGGPPSGRAFGEEGRTYAGLGEGEDVGAEVTSERARPERAMTPDIENISDLSPSSPAPGGARERYSDETPARTPIAGHETAGPGVRTGSSGAAALDAGSGGPIEGEYDPRGNRRSPTGEEER